MRLRPVAPRASRTAVLVASVPLFMKRTRSHEGTLSEITSANFISRGVGAPYEVPSPAALRIDKENLVELRRHGISYSFHNTAEEVIDKLDCLYLTRVQKERFGELNFEPYKITLKTLRNAKPNLKIMHPLPRVDELPVEIDDTPYAYYFAQAKNGVYVRQALLDMIFEGND